jgi:hypothetical protein
MNADSIPGTIESLNGTNYFTRSEVRNRPHRCDVQEDLQVEILFGKKEIVVVAA